MRKNGMRSIKILLIQMLVMVVAVTGLYANITGTVFRDLPVNGTTLGVYGVKHASELGVKDVNVIAYDTSGAVSATATTSADGTYTLGTGAGDYRVEFSAWPAYLKESPDASGSATSVQFVADGTTTANLGLHNPADYTNTTNPKLISSIFVNGLSNTGDPVSDQGGLYKWDYAASGAGDASEAQIANEQNVGNVWGIAYDKKREKVYAATVVKRHAGVLDNELGRIYETNVDGSGTATFIDIPDAGNLADDTARGLGGLGNRSRDSDAVGAALKQGLGDIDISDDQSTLYVINLNDKKLYEVDIASKTITGSYDTPNPCVANTGENRPFAVEVTEGKVFIGVVCDASISGLDSDLTADVYEFDGTNFTSIYHHALDYVRQQSENGTVGWHSWSDDYQTIAQLYTGSNYWKVVRSQPVLADIKFADNGNLIIGLLDRAGFQGGFRNYPIAGVPFENHEEYKTISGGDMLIATPNGAGQYIADSRDEDASANTESVSADNSPVNEHKESALGAITIFRGSGEVTIVAYDPVGAFHSAGVVFFDESNGSRTDAYTVLENTNPQMAHFGKGAGMGDIEILTTLAPVEIGNRVWMDADADGVQDAGESGIAGITVELYDATGVTLLATATTDANGNYIFSSDTAGTTTASHKYGIAGLNPNTEYIVRIPNVSGGSKQGVLGTNVLTTSNQGTDIHDSDGIASGTNANAIVLATDIPLAGANNHSFDFGFTPSLVSLGSTVFNDTDNSGTQDAGEAGIAGLTVTLYEADGTTVVTTTTTDENGTYFFGNLPAGDYVVGVIPNASFPMSSTPTSTSDDDVDGNDDGTQANSGDEAKSAVITLSVDGEVTTEVAQGDDITGHTQDDADDDNGNMTVDFGFLGLGSWSGNVSKDNNHNNVGDENLAGVTIKLYSDPNGDGDPSDGVLIGTTTTDANGNYKFNDLIPGDYVAVETQPAGLQNVKENEGGSDNDKPNNGIVNAIAGTVDTGEEDVHNDFVEEQYLGAITGNVSKTDSSGNLTPLANVTLVLFDSNGNEVARTTTDANGNYRFEAPPGNYYIQEQQPSGYFDVRENEGGSDNDATNGLLNTISVVVSIGETDVHNDFVESTTSSITGCGCPPRPCSLCNTVNHPAHTHNLTDNSTELHWNDYYDEIAYEIYVNGKFIAIVDEDTVRYTLKGLQSATEYTAVIIADNGYGNKVRQTIKFKTTDSLSWLPAIYNTILF